MSSRLGSGQDRRLGLREGGEICALACPFVFPPFALAGAEPARQLTVFTPSGIEDLFDALMPVLAGGGEETPEAVPRRMRRTTRSCRRRTGCRTVRSTRSRPSPWCNQQSRKRGILGRREWKLSALAVLSLVSRQAATAGRDAPPRRRG